MVGASFNWNNSNMATKKAPIGEQAIPNVGDDELDQAIDDLRGVLKSDSAGTLPGSDFGMDFGATEPSEPLSDFGSSFSDTSGGLDSFGGDFGSTGFGDEATSGTAFGTSDFSGSDDFGAAAFDAGAASSEPGSSLTSNLDLIMDIPIDVQIVLGSSRMQVSSLMNLTEGATIALDRRIGEAVDIVVNGRMIGRGEITVLEHDETRFGVKLIEIKGTSKV